MITLLLLSIIFSAPVLKAGYYCFQLTYEEFETQRG